MPPTVVILGAGWAGLPLAHKLLKYTGLKVPELKVILISPNSHFFWNVAATRGLIPGEIPDEELFIPIEPGFEQYSRAGGFEFVLGAAEGFDVSKNAVDIKMNNGSQRSIIYDQLVIATGSQLKGNLPLKPLGSHETNLSAWHELQHKVETAKSIIVSGGGPTGVEVAGELAAKYGSRKRITLVVSGGEPVTSGSASVRSVISKDLQKLGVEVITNTRVTDIKQGSADKQTTVTLSSGIERNCDLHLPLHGISVNTSFVPAHLLDADGNLLLQPDLRVSSTTNVWGIGDVGNIEPKQLTVTDNQIIYMASALDCVLTGSEPEKPYEPVGKTMLFLSLGKRHGTGQVGNWRLFGFMVNYVKGRRLFVDTARGYVGGKHLRHAAM